MKSAPALTLYGLLHALAVRVSGEGGWDPCTFWATGWRGVDDQVGVRVHMELVDRALCLRVIDADAGVARRTMDKVLRVLDELVRDGWPGVAATADAVLLACVCDTWAPSAAVARVREVGGRVFKCPACGATVPLGALEDGAELAAADNASCEQRARGVGCMGYRCQLRDVQGAQDENREQADGNRRQG